MARLPKRSEIQITRAFLRGIDIRDLAKARGVSQREIEDIIRRNTDRRTAPKSWKEADHG